MSDATFDNVVRVLRGLRVHTVRDEAAIQAEVARLLTAAAIDFETEVSIGRRSRVDFLVGSGLVIELKQGKPNSTRTIKQLRRYAAVPQITGIILVVERNIFWLPKHIEGKPAAYVSLSANWGVAL